MTVGARVVVGDRVLDGRSAGLVTLVSADMPGYLAVDFGGVLSVKHLDDLLVPGVRPANDFTAYLASENGWSVGRAGVVVREMLVDAGFPPAACMTEHGWERLARAYFDADVHRASFAELAA